MNVCVNVNVNTTDATTGATALLLNVCLCDTNTQHVNSTRNETHVDGELRNSKEKRESDETINFVSCNVEDPSLWTVQCKR